MKKRILSIVLAVLMLLSVLPTTALAAEESVVPQNIVTAEHGGVKVEKRAEWTDEKNGKAKITFTLTGGTMTSQDIPVTDIVLVIDKSASMSKNGSPKMNNAKKAAVSFVDKFFGTGADQGYKDKVRIAVVSYSGSANTVVGLTNKINDLTSGINNIRADGGTHIQAGIYRAQQILDADNREKVKKLIVVLSDGEPTYSYAFTATGTFTGCTKTEWWESCNARLTSHGAFTADYTKRLGAGTSFSGMETNNGIFSWNWENSGNAYVSGTCNKNHDRTQYGAYAVNGTFTANGSSNHGVGTIWEANQAKAKGTEIFAVGFGLGADDTNAINTMKGVATDDDHYKAATTSDISHIFDTIADTITKAIAKDAKLTDPLGAGFKLTTPEGGATYSENIDELSGTETIEFEIQYDTAHPAAGDTLPTNDGATLTYTDADGKPQIIHIGNPELENLARTVTYVDENGNAYTDPAHQEKPHWYGDTVTLAPAPTKEGYTFNGWTTDDVDIGENDTFEMPKQNVTLKASWIKNEPTTMDITITKIWDDSVSIDRYRSAKIQLYANGEERNYFYARQGANVPYKSSTMTFTKLPVKGADGKDIVYTVKEIEINDQAVTSENQLVTEDEIWTGVVTGDAKTGFTVTNSVRKNERYGVEVTKTATRDRTLADGTTDTVALATTGDKVRVGDVIHYTVTIKNTGNVKFPAGSRAGDTFAAATGSLIDDATGKEIPSGSQTAPIAIALTEPNVTVTKTYTYIVLEADTRITNTANASIPNGTMEPERDSDAVVVTVEKPHGVTYEFEAGLPEDLQEYLPEEDTGRYYKGDSVAVRNPKQNSATIGNTKYTFAGWYVNDVMVGDSYTMDETDVTFVGKWAKEEQPPEPISITVEKSWNTNNSESVVTPNEISVQLTQNGVDYGEPVELSVANNWMHIFNNLPKVDGEGNPYTYSVKELSDLEAKDADGNVIGTWKPSIVPTDGKITITNTFEEAEQPEETIDITVKKSWATERYNEDLKLPDSVEVALLQNEKQIATATLYKSSNKNNIDSSYAHKFENLPKYDAEGNEYVYTVKELGDKIARSEDGDRIGIWKDTYEENAEGWHIKNTLVEDGTEPEDHEFTAHIVKRFENKSGKSPKATFTFIAALADGTEVGRKTISFSKGDVDVGDIGRDEATMNVTLTDKQYEELERDKYGYRYLWIYEEDGEVDGVKYDTKPQKAYIYEKPVAWSLEFDEDGGLVFSVPDENTLYCLVGDEMVEDFVFTNTYKKSGKVEKPVKVGPQLNRDDHVAYIMGYPDGTVQPEGEITRAEACTIFFRLLTDSSRDYYFSKTNDYTDVNAGDWFNNAISTLSNAGIVTGYNDGTFRPNQPITRGEMAKIIANFANLNKGTKSFTDLSGHWSKTYVELAAGNGWIAGYPDGSFRPDQKITRAETVTMINRVLERVPAKELRLLSRSIMLTFPDNNPGDWYYIAIQEASNSHEYQRSVYETAGDEMWTKLIDNVDWTKLEK